MPNVVQALVCHKSQEKRRNIGRYELFQKFSYGPVEET